MIDLVLQAPDFDANALAAVRELVRPESEKADATCVRLFNVKHDDDVRRQVRELARRAVMNAAFVAADLKLTDFGALFFDMDSTLVNSETLDEMADIAGVGEQCAAITAGAMSGRIANYADSLRERVKLLEGHDAESIETVWRNMRLNEGAERLIKTALAAGLKAYIVSSGFTVLTERVKEKLGMTGTCANNIDVCDGRFTGRVCGPTFAPFNGTILDADGKAAFVRQTMSDLGMTPAQSICFGDGSNDVKMLRQAGIGVGFHPKDILRPECTLAVDALGLDCVLNLFSDTCPLCR